MFEARRR